MVTAQEVRSNSLEKLEQLYREAPVAPVGPVPTRAFQGEVLHRVDSPHARTWTAGAVLLPFERLSFGVDFGTCAWFFLHARVQLGRFRVESGPSRWRQTPTLQLHYDVSRLPFRGVLYDEVKPLSETLCLGLGGLNRDLGDLFFFVLEAR
jgi:hypothetical protein